MAQNWPKPFTRVVPWLGRIPWSLLPLALLGFWQASDEWGQVLSNDSYAMLGLGRSLWQGDGYVAKFIRDHAGFVQWPQPSRSFPPIWPMLLGLLDNCWPSAWPWPQVCLALACFFGAVLLISTTLPLAYRTWGGVWWLCYCLAQPALREELLAARSIPCALGVLLLIWYVSGLPVSWLGRVGYHGALLGVLCGLLLLLRYDLVLPCLLWPGLWSLWQGQRRWSCLLWAYSGLLLLLAPWWSRQLYWFGSPFASEHQVAALSVATGLVPLMGEDAWQCGLCAQPWLWLQQRCHYFWRNSWRLLASPCFAGLLPLAGCYWFKTRRQPQSLWLRYGWLWLALVSLGQLVTQSFTSYSDIRYGLPSCTLAAIQLQVSTAATWRQKYWQLLWWCALLPMLLSNSIGRPFWQPQLKMLRQQQQQERLLLTAAVPFLPNWQLLATHQAEYVATILDVPAITWPRQSTVQQQQTWQARFHVQAGLASKAWLMQHGWWRANGCCWSDQLCWVGFVENDPCPWSKSSIARNAPVELKD